MYLGRPEIDAAAAACEAAGRELGAEWAAAAGTDEDDFTSRLIERIGSKLARLDISGVRWQARKTTSRFERSEESLSGADLLAVLEVSAPGVVVRKGFLAQAKIRGKGSMRELRAQCSAMLQITPASFIFIYDKGGVQVLPAVLYANGSLGLRHAEPWSLAQLFAAHFGSFVGDRRLTATTREEFGIVLNAAPPKDIMLISAGLGDAESPKLD